VLNSSALVTGNECIIFDDLALYRYPKTHVTAITATIATDIGSVIDDITSLIFSLNDIN
jgi:hypothetical protein